jgi:catechol 2,3-dioxygenase-like lactoylglutathione lyase family enzyme
MIHGLDHINIVVSDLDRARRFFELFGFKTLDASALSGEWISEIVQLEDVSARYVRLELPGTACKIELIVYDHPVQEDQIHPGRANQIGLRHLAFAVKDIELEVTRLENAGVEFLSDIHVYQKLGKKLVYFYGPDGILLELAEYGTKQAE